MSPANKAGSDSDKSITSHAYTFNAINIKLIHAQGFNLFNKKETATY